MKAFPILHAWHRIGARLLLGAAGLLALGAHAQETVCARVKIEIKQELTLERQAFDAEMKITNTLPEAGLSEVRVDVRVTDEAGQAVRVTADPSDTAAQFFIRVSNKQNLGGDIDGSGIVSANSTAQINWLIIPSTGAAANNPLGKKYLVGASLKYKFGAETHTLDVSPDVITVKPLPRLTLDYFLPQDVLADDPLTSEVEPVVPFTLGVRVKNAGIAPARTLKIDSAQPRIVENQQGLLIAFKLTGSFVDDAAVNPTLKLDFGQIDGGKSKMGRWLMETTLAGRFTEFTAKYTHSDELGGQVTSLLEAVNTHFLLRDVRVDLTGRDFVRDFLAQDIDAIRVYESEGTDTAVQNLTAQATLTAVTDPQGRAIYRFQLPATQGFVYARLRDPFNGARVLGPVVRDDAKPIAPENLWLSTTRNPQTKLYEYWVSVFDANTPGGYTAEFKTPSGARQPPVLQLIADRTVRERQQVSFLVEASSPDGRGLTLSAAPLPVGATFQRDASSTNALARWVFDWTPASGQAGRFPLQFSASDGELSASRQAVITVTSETPPNAPQLPLIDAPQVGVTVRTLQPDLIARVPTVDDPATAFMFEVYADAGLTVLAQSASSVARTGETGTWRIPVALNDNATYYWRVRTSGAGTFSPWVNGRFRVNLANDAPRPFAVASPSNNGQARSLTPALTVVNAFDPDGDALAYTFEVFADNALTQLVVRSNPVAEFTTGSTSWTVAATLTEGQRYWWRAIARDPEGALSETAIVSFTVNTGNRPPSAPSVVAPAVSSVVPATAAQLTVTGSGDADGDVVSYQFELDTTPSFSGAVQASGTLPAAPTNTVWQVANLQENIRYYWRARAVDPQGAASGWTQAEFFVNAVNEAPATPVPANPGAGSTIDTVQPRLQAAPAADPDLDAVTYDFELYGNATLTSLLLAGSASTPELQVPSGILEEGKTYHWRTRTRDPGGLASAWSSTIQFAVRPRPQPPRITLTAPAAPTEVTTSTTTIAYEAIDPQADAAIALFYNTQNTGVGTQIIDGLRLDANSSTGSHAWTLTGINPGTYYVYGVISNSVGSFTHYAPGAIIIPVPQPTAGVTVNAASPLVTTEAGGTATFTVALISAPTADVTIGITSSNALEGKVAPALLTFTQANWNVPQTVTVTGIDDCGADGDVNYTVVLGRAASLDANYNNFKPNDVAAVNRDNDASTVCPQRFDGSAFVANSGIEGFAVSVGLPLYYKGQATLGAVLGVTAATPFTAGKAYTWKVIYDGSRNGSFAIHDGPTLIAAKTYTGTLFPLRTGNAVQVTATSLTLVGQPNNVRVALTRLNGYPVDAVLQTVNTMASYQTSAYYRTPLLSAGMTLEGTVTFTHSVTLWPAAVVLAFYVRMGNVAP